MNKAKLDDDGEQAACDAGAGARSGSLSHRAAQWMGLIWDTVKHGHNSYQHDHGVG